MPLSPLAGSGADWFEIPNPIAQLCIGHGAMVTHRMVPAQDLPSTTNFVEGDNSAFFRRTGSPESCSAHKLKS